MKKRTIYSLEMILCILLLFAGLSAVAGEAWSRYTNDRFGFILSYPSSLVAGKAPQNGAGKEFRLADKAFSIVSEGHFLPEGDSLHRRYSTEIRLLGNTVNYKAKGKTWYVISGTHQNGYEYYYKFYVRERNWVGFRITYPQTKRKIFDPWVERIEKSFVPFLIGDFDRVR